MHGPAELELVRVRWGFRSYGAWVLANAVGGAAGASVILLSGSVILLTGMYDTPLLMLALCVFGTILAVPQALVLRDYVRRPITWIWATGLVWAGVTLLFFGPLPALLPESIPHPFDPRTSFDRSAVVFVFLPAAGVMVGTVQAWLMALPWRRAVAWGIASTIAGVAMIPAGTLTYLASALMVSPAFGLAAGSGGGLVYGLLTGLALPRVQGRKRSSNPPGDPQRIAS